MLAILAMGGNKCIAWHERFVRAATIAEQLHGPAPAMRRAMNFLLLDFTNGIKI
jgi:hypothetical protein